MTLPNPFLEAVAVACETLAKRLREGNPHELPHVLKAITHPAGRSGFRFTTEVSGSNGEPLEVQVRTLKEL